MYNLKRKILYYKAYPKNLLLTVLVFTVFVSIVYFAIWKQSYEQFHSPSMNSVVAELATDAGHAKYNPYCKEIE